VKNAKTSIYTSLKEKHKKLVTYGHMEKSSFTRGLIAKQHKNFDNSSGSILIKPEEKEVAVDVIAH
jgi:hypothetical protein